ncbi:hypothetical protein SO694_0029708 [Aureococcus anophagefferens]|uniref:DUF4057 domain-containing protein n=1 Tax=Aureococcus anophagefferens TaxID=44056 RepID=A0ABR1FP73_AURAN
MLPGMLENHYAEEGSRALRAASTQRAVVPRERRFVDQDMGQAYLVGGSRDDAPDGAWACMTHMPYKAPARAPRPAPGDVAPARAPSPPRYDASAGAAAREARGGPVASVFTGGGVGGARDGGEGLARARLGGLDAFAIGNPRAETFHLRTRSTKRVGITPASHEHNEQYYKDRAGRKVFATSTGGGASSVGFSDGGGGGLSAALSPGKAGKKAVARSPPKQESLRDGRKHGNRSATPTPARAPRRAGEPGGAVPRRAAPRDLRRRAAGAVRGPRGRRSQAQALRWSGTKSTHGEPRGRDALEHAAVKLVEEARADEPPAAPAPRAPPRAPPPARAAPRASPPTLVARATSSRGDDPFRGQREKLQFVEPSPAKHSGARCGAIGDSDGGKNSILGNRSIKTTRPPGGGSSINLGWD